jgi:hypothetical protein
MPWWFIIIIILFIITLITGCIRRIPKLRKKVITQSKDKRDKLINVYVKIIKMYKIMFITIPLYLLILPYLLYRYFSYQEFIYGTAIFILAYIFIIEDFIYRKSIVREIQIMEAQEVNSISQPISPGQ